MLARGAVWGEVRGVERAPLRERAGTGRLGLNFGGDRSRLGEPGVTMTTEHASRSGAHGQEQGDSHAGVTSAERGMKRQLSA